MSNAEDKQVENFVRYLHSKILYRNNKEKWVCLPNIYAMKKSEEWMKLCPCLTKYILEMIVNNCNDAEYVFENEKDICKTNTNGIYIKPLDNYPDIDKKSLFKNHQKVLSKIIECFLLVYACKDNVGEKEFYVIRNLYDEDFLCEQLELEANGLLEEYKCDIISDIKLILTLFKEDITEDNVIQTLQMGNSSISESYTYKLLGVILEKCRTVLNGDISEIYRKVGNTLFNALSCMDYISA